MQFMQKLVDIFKLESTRMSERTVHVAEDFREMSESKALSEIDRANRLADIANKTTDREEFYNAIEEIESILSELSKYEHKFSFSYPPSASLRDLKRDKDEQIKVLEKRIVEKEKTKITLEEKKISNSYDIYNENIAKKKENNLNISYDDMKCYDLKPFDLKKPFISDGHFTAIALEGENLEKAYKYLNTIHEILSPFKHLYVKADFPNKIGIDYMFGCTDGHLPVSHLRLSPYTATMRNNKYPFWLWLSSCSEYGTEYIYMIYFNQDGEIGKADLSLHGFNGSRLSYESKIRQNENGLYVMRINETIYVEPYGTKILYHYQDEENFQKGNNAYAEKVAINEIIDKEKTIEEFKPEPDQKIPKLSEDQTKLEMLEYILPPFFLLDKKQNLENCIDEIKQRAEKLTQTFSAFGINAEITDISHGARFTRFEVQVGTGIRIKDILKIKDDIKLNLEAANLHIEAPIAGKTTIGIDVENKEFSPVTFREMIESKEFQENPSELAIAIGKDTVGNVIVENLENLCHLLIGGTTGSGKSVCVNSIIMSILYKAESSKVKMILIDTKANNLFMYNGIPHLMIPIVTDLRKATAALQWCVEEMTDRYKKFSCFGVKDLKGYNAAVEKRFSNDESLQKMPSIVIIVDDFSDLMIADNNSTEESVCRLAQMGRACGIHLIISTQRPSVDVITGIIKANMPSRIAFNVFSAIDSRTILDTKGAEDLLPDGDMLFSSLGARKPVRMQGTFVSDEEIENVIRFIKKQTSFTPCDGKIENKISKIQNPYIYSVSTAKEVYRDEYFEEAGRFIIEHDKASIGMLQRYFKIGFNRAARIMDQLAEAGVVGEEVGTTPRKTLMTLEAFEKYLEENN